jgi:hypothetical protein
VLWDDDNLYISFRIEEPRLHAKYTNRNDPIYYDNDVEVFIGGRDAYYEFEINGFNTSYEVFFIWDDSYEQHGFATAPEFARSKLKPFNGVDFKTHPRGGRLGHFDWSFPGKRTAVSIDGTLNNDADEDRGWTVELAFPWRGMKWLATDGRAVPPKQGDVWRMDFSRFNTYQGAAAREGFGRLGLEPPWRMGLAHPGMFSVHSFRHERRAFCKMSAQWLILRDGEGRPRKRS